MSPAADHQSGSHSNHWTRDRVSASAKVLPEASIGVLYLRIDSWDSGSYHTGQEQRMDLGCKKGASELSCRTKDAVYEVHLTRDAIGDSHARFVYRIGTGVDGFEMTCAVPR